MRLSLLALLLLTAVGCASSTELAQRADARTAAANQAVAAGDLARARDQQRRAEELYQRANARAFEESRPSPPPPANLPLPVFDPQLER